MHAARARRDRSDARARGPAGPGGRDDRRAGARRGRLCARARGVPQGAARDLAKALGGGLPLGAVAASRELHAKWQTGTHGSTFGGNPVSCASGLATLRVIQEERLIERAETVGAIVEEELRPIARDERVREIRRIGAMVAVEFDDKARSKSAIAGALERDVLLITCGSHDQVVRFIPPLNIAEGDLRQGVRAFVEAAKAA
ncbi:MAG: aminotransferase class III-fold pyridoxal phosphate-dependent enzyme, partial [Chloroflexi bacterium]|nr:aminotransferase class III-fold pyridoxal phosphate-dependent enzyme [Chloroflexota bacterium]